MKLIVGAMGKEIEAVIKELKELKINYSNISLYQGYLEDELVYVLKTGIGKITSTYTLTKALMILENLKIKIDLIINIGLVGSTPNYNIGCVYLIEKNTLSDFDLSVFNEYFKIFEISKKYNNINEKLNIQKAFLFTQDKFVTKLLDTNISSYLVDMELSSIWTVCENENIDLISLKFVSDHIIHDNQVELYKSNKNIDSSKVLLEYIKKLLRELK